MVFPNLPYKGDQIPNQPFNYPEVPATFDRLFGSLVPNIQLDPNPSLIGEEYSKWVRPTDWLTLPTLDETQEKFVGLFAVYDVDSNFLAFTFYDDYIVNWGDGHVETYNSGDKAQHSYSWNSVPASTLTSEGYKQVIVTVTPQSGSHLVSMDLATYPDNMGLGSWNYISVPWLDIALSMPQAESGDSIYFGTNDSVSMGSLEKVTIVNAGGATDFYYLLGYNCRNLGEFNLLSAPDLYNLEGAFYNCNNLKNVNICDLPSVYYLNILFQSCYNLEHIELTGLSSANDFANIFAECNSLKSVKMSGLTDAEDLPLSYILSSYTDQPNTRSLTLEDLNSLTDLENVTYDWGSDFKGSVKLTGLTGVTDLEYAFAYNYDLESVELSGLENVTGGSYYAFGGCQSLKNVKLDGIQSVSATDYMFADCYSLEKAPEFNTSTVENMQDMFEYCYSLTDIPLYDTSIVENTDYMFYECYSLRTVPQFDTSQVYNFYEMFGYCYSLETIPLLDTSSGEDLNYMFEYCQSLQKLPALDLSPATSTVSMVQYCSSLAAAPFQNTSVGISYEGCCLSRNAIVDIFNGLATASATIDVSYNYGVDDLTAEDISIAEDKGWTVTY